MFAKKAANEVDNMLFIAEVDNSWSMEVHSGTVWRKIAGIRVSLRDQAVFAGKIRNRCNERHRACLYKFI